MTDIHSVLGFDFGLKRIGMATGQMVTKTASPLITLRSVNNSPDWNSIEHHIKQWQPDALIVGLPTMLDGSETDITRAARNFSRQLEHRFNLPVFLIDENLSSRAAEEQLKQNNKISKHNKHEIDKIAAAIIVQSWLNTQTN